jgi:uncharacterized protein (TIGR03437 family)
MLLFSGLVATPVLLFAFSSGPPQARTGAPVDGGLNCTACHRSNPVNTGPGRVTITAVNYTPGTKQTIQVRVEHPDQMRWGFQLTARIQSDQTKKAGTFAPDDNIRVRCGLSGTAEAPCAADAVEFAEHRVNATNPGQRAGRTFEIQWTPPDSDVGPIIFYAAGNAANNDGTNSGDFIYTTNLTISPAAAGAKPAISSGGIADAFNFSIANGISSNTWIAIVGQNLAPTTRTWDDAITGASLPTQLSGVSVKINNKPAPIYFVSPAQINALAPLDDDYGDVSVVVTTPAGDSAPFTVKRVEASPAFYTPFAQNNRLFVTAVALDGTLIGKVGVDSRVSRAARPGETIQLFGTGFGDTDPEVPTERIVSGAPELEDKPTIRIGETVVDFPGKGNLVSAGIYQFNITIPSGLADGDYAIVAEIGGVRSAANVFISVAR